MRHRSGYKKLNVDKGHRRSLLANLAAALINNGQIMTTLPKAKALRPYVEKLVTISKNNSNLFATKMLSAKLYDFKAVQLLTHEIKDACAERSGGYTRILKAGYRYGDAAPMAYIAFVDQEKIYSGKDKTADKNPNN